MRRRRRLIPGFLITMFWVVPFMAVLAGGGYFLGRYFLAERYLNPAEVQANRPKPVPILKQVDTNVEPQDAPSRVWTDGVQDEDIPKLEPEKSEHRSSRRSRHSTTPTPADSATTSTPSDTRTPPAPATPAAGGNDAITPD